MIIEEHIPLQPFNTFQLPAKARHFVRVRSLEELREVRASKVFSEGPVLMLGGGSNLLFTGDYPGLIVKNELLGKEIIDEDQEHIWINVMGGENWHELVHHCVRNGWGGIENLALIPGCAGAAPIQNIGAYGVEIKDVFVSLEAFMWDTGETRVFFGEDCQFGYRNSIFKGPLKGSAMICSLTIRLSLQPRVNTDYGAIREVLQRRRVQKPGIGDVFGAVMEIRRSKLPDPAHIGNAGSFFKNPELPRKQAEDIFAKFGEVPHYVVDESTVKIPAGWMIEHCGWKGYRVGDIGVHDKQALVLVNYGRGDGAAIKHLAEQIQRSVLDQFGVALQPEVNII